MKKVLFSAVALLAFGFVNAQEKSNGGFSKGDVFASGAFSLSSEKTGEYKTNSFELAPKVGFFVTENIAIGGKLGYSTDKVSVSSDNATNTGLGLGAFGRYYLTPASQFSLFAEFGLDYTSYDNEYTVDASGTPSPADSKSKELGFGLGAGMNYFVSSNFSIEAGVAVLGYSSNDNGGNGADKTNTFSFGGDWRAVTFGVNYKF
jgi:outer membrane protein